ncbi:MAG: sigma 54-interacting transcriptional regulator [Polyangiaceae bacterium]|nr:sigma 54-interacting transcriptional regulator [Polyangiaceae bacterium]
MTFLDDLFGQRDGDKAAALAQLLETAARSAGADAAAALAAGDDGAFSVVAVRGLGAEIVGSRLDDPNLRTALRRPGALRYDAPGPFGALVSSRVPRPAAMVVPALSGGRSTGMLVLFAASPVTFDRLTGEDASVLGALLAAVLVRLHRSSLPERSASAVEPVLGSSGAAQAGAAGPAILGESASMQRLDREIRLLARMPTTVLVLGETGSGKELVARALHQRSPRAQRPFIVVNCGALPVHLVEAELFGHTKGAFTGAAGARAGKIDAADEGTLFLDEVGELPPVAQAQLLRVLQEGEVQRVGDDRVHRVDVRVIAATHRDLRREVSEGRFREDLLHRLWVYPLLVPPLRERGGDAALLAIQFAARSAEQIGIPPPELDALAKAAITAHAWPGNVRELKHAVERAILHRLAAASSSGGAFGARGEVRPLGPRVTLSVQDFELRAERGAAAGAGEPPPSPRAADAPVETLDAALERVRREAFERAFRESEGNAAEAARRLGLSRSFAYKEAVRLGLVSRAKGR